MKKRNAQERLLAGNGVNDLFFTADYLGRARKAARELAADEGVPSFLSRVVVGTFVTPLLRVSLDEVTPGDVGLGPDGTAFPEVFLPTGRRVSYSEYLIQHRGCSQITGA
jgi:hypothetical protein